MQTYSTVDGEAPRLEHRDKQRARLGRSDLRQRLSRIGCDDAPFGSIDSVPYAEFTREATVSGGTELL
jgi:hypothetical protein